MTNNEYYFHRRNPGCSGVFAFKHPLNIRPGYTVQAPWEARTCWWFYDVVVYAEFIVGWNVFDFILKPFQVCIKPTYTELS